MKNFTTLLLIGLAGAAFMSAAMTDNSLKGAWVFKNDKEIHSIIFSEKFWSLAVYNVTDKRFISTRGGSYKSDGKELVFLEEYNSADGKNIGKEKSIPCQLEKNSIVMALDEKSGRQSWTRTDNGSPGKLSGAWLITGRMDNNEMHKMTPGARRTMKILSGTRFQWIAYNVETKELFGTGGGTYKTDDDKYVESIEFFSRDNSRVGKSLEFDFSIENEKWRHKGFSSKGDPIDEEWTKREVLGI